MKVILICNQKGGVAKTTTTLAMANILNKAGHKTLIIDTDVQGNTTSQMGAKIEDTCTLYDVIVEPSKENRCKIEEAIQHTERGDIIASDPLLERAELDLASDSFSAFNLKNAFNESKISEEYEYVIIDSGPRIDKLLTCALVATDEVLIPIEAAPFSLEGLSQVANPIKQVQQTFNQNLKIGGILMTMYDEKTNLSKSIKEVADKIAEAIGTRVFDTFIRKTTKVGEAQSFKQSLNEYAPYATAERDYEQFLEEYLGVEV